MKWCVRLLCCKVIPLLPPYTLYSLEGSHCAQPTLREWGVKYLHKLFGILVHRLLSILYLFIQSFGLEDIYFVPWITIQCYFCSYWSSFDCWEFLLGSCVSVVYMHFIFLPLFEYFLALEDIPQSFCIIFALLLDSAISLRSFGSFYWRMVLEIKVWKKKTD